jgi:hypothetical protein
MITYSGGVMEGAFVLQYIEGDPTLFGSFPAAASVSDVHGVWVRTGPNTFRTTQQGYGLDGGHGAASNIVYFSRASSTVTLLDCNTMEIEVYVMEILLPPNMDPIEFGRSCVPPVIQYVLPAWRITPEELCEE